MSEQRCDNCTMPSGTRCESSIPCPYAEPPKIKQEPTNNSNELEHVQLQHSIS